MTENEVVLLICLACAFVADFIALFIIQLIERNNYRKQLHDNTITCKDIRIANAEHKKRVLGAYMASKHFWECLPSDTENVDNANENEP